MEKVESKTLKTIKTKLQTLDFKHYISIAGGFAIVIAILYLLSFWKVFKIDILEYIPLSDLILWSIYPFVTILAIFHFITLIIFTSGTWRSKLIWIIIPSIFIILSVITMIKLMFVSGVFSLGLVLVAFGLKAILTLLIEKGLSFKIFLSVVALILAIVISGFSGYYKAQMINEGISYKFIYSNYCKYDKDNPDNVELRFIGKIDEFNFFKNSNDNTIIVLEHNQIEILRYHNFLIELNLEFDEQKFFEKRWQFILTLLLSG